MESKSGAWVIYEVCGSPEDPIPIRFWVPNRPVELHRRIDCAAAYVYISGFIKLLMMVKL